MLFTNPPELATFIHGLSLNQAGTMVVFLISKDRFMIRKLKSGEYKLYSRKKDPKTNKRRNLGTFTSLAAAKKHEKEIQFFKRHK